MSKSLPACLVLLGLLATLLSGCGGGESTPVLIAGDFFPLAAGRTWDYSTAITVETPWKDFATTGTFTREVTGIVPVTIHGSTVNAFEVVHTATVADPATGSDVGPANMPVVQAVNFLFQPNVGFREVRAYYHVSAANPGFEPRVTLVALAEGGGPITPVPGPQPIFLNPPFDGFERLQSLPFIPIPLMPPTDSLATPTVTGKVLAFNPGGPGNSLFDIYYFSADVDFNGTAGQMSGRGRNFMLPDIGLASDVASTSDWAQTLQVGGYWARVSIAMNLLP